MQVKDYAEAVGSSTTHISNVINGNEPGSLKMVRDCLRRSDLDITDCLLLPAEGDEAEERDLMSAFRLLGPVQRAAVLINAQAFLAPNATPKPATHHETATKKTKEESGNIAQRVRKKDQAG